MKTDGDKTKQELDDSGLRESDAPLTSVRLLTGRVLANRIFDGRSWPVEAPITLCARASRRFARELSLRRRFQGSDLRGFLNSQFGNRFDSGNTRLRASERVYKQPGRFFRNTTFRSITDVLMSFNTSQFVQHLRIFLNQVLSNPSVLTKESGKSERVTLSRSHSRSLLPSTDRRELLSSTSSSSSSSSSSSTSSSSSSSSVLMSLVTYQARDRTALSQTVTLIRRDMLSQLSQAVRTTALHFQRETIARLFAHTQTHLETEKSNRTQFNGSYMTTLQEKIAATLRQIFVHTIGPSVSGPKFSTAKLRPQREPLGRPAPLARTQDTQLSRPDTQLPATHVEREFSLTSASRIMTERSLINLIDRHRESSQPIHISRQPGSPVIFSSFARGSDFRRLEKTLSQLNSTETILNRQSTLEAVINRSGSIGRFLRDNNFFNTNQLKQFSSRCRAIETDRSLRATFERTLAMKEGGMAVPSNGFVFAQPLRQEAPAERVVKRVEAREVVEIVKKEVNQSLASVASLRNFTHQDYEEISEQVYSSLVRRLTIERERLGFG